VVTRTEQMETHATDKPVPVDEPEQQPYWDATARHELAVQRCEKCEKFVHPPSPSCPLCGVESLEWMTFGSEISGHVYSFVVTYRSFTSGFVEDAPYAVGLCDVDSVPGVRIVANIIGDVDDVQIGRRVEMIWEDRETFTAPQWRLVDGD
jgi:uncharacterized protein